MTEQWKKIPDLPYYEASTLGRIRSRDRHLPFMTRWGTLTNRFHRGRVLRLKPKPNGCGDIYWSFYAGAEGGDRQASRAVCRAFNGPPPSSRHEAAHLDGNTNNNRPDNLVWATPKENAAHKIRHGTAPIGSGNGASRLRERDIPAIFEAYCRATSADEIAATYGVDRNTIIKAVTGRSWKHVDVGSNLREKAKDRARLNIEAQWAAAERRMAERGHSLVAS